MNYKKENKLLRSEIKELKCKFILIKEILNFVLANTNKFNKLYEEELNDWSDIDTDYVSDSEDADKV